MASYQALFTLLLYFVGLYVFFGIGFVGGAILLALGVLLYAVLLALVRKPKVLGKIQQKLE